ncbi:hypothetical protein K4749_38930 [Streptomyces sp. TRM72054]|uniref:hypothetical protein n=1 Tax=Streptomyces sp. TRM72054 TaxID=2870562 RepID=UPI001C8C77A0|nr:hypothetical protein [Streptomyces sp. TRM72054]MBX9399369.1 hypothetical protein [Streptomyces sp. TRM72054]
MTDDRERGERVVEILVPLLQACTALQAGEPTRLTHRGGGLRLVLDVQPNEGPTSVRLEREDTPPRTSRAPGRRRALPPRPG